VGRESLGKTGTAGFAKTIDDETAVVMKITRAKWPANFAFAKTFFNEIFRVRSDPSRDDFFNTASGKFPETEFSQSRISIDIHPRENSLQPLYFRALLMVNFGASCKLILVLKK
jgi:hypothetical protein